MIWLLLSAALALAAAQTTTAFGTVLLLVTLLSAIVIAVGLVQGRHEELSLLRPETAGLAYIVFALLVPQIYIVTTGNGIGYLPATALSPATVAVDSVFVCAFIAGTSARRLTSQSAAQRGVSTSGANIGSLSQRVALGGRLVLAAAIAAKALVVASRGSVYSAVYGQNQYAYDATASLDVLASMLIVAGSALLMHANVTAGRRPVTLADTPLVLGVLLVCAVLLGSRDEMLYVAILFIWFLAARGMRQFFLKVLLLVVMVVGLSLVVVTLRTADDISFPLIERVLQDTASPLYLTSVVTGIVPQSEPFLWGSTYWAAIPYLLPGPLARAVFGNPGSTGTFEFIRLAQYEGTDNGFGFAMTTEGFLNGGMLGVGIAGLILGVVMQSAYGWATRMGRSITVRQLVYPIVLAYLPYALRADFLAQLKGVLYPVVMIWFVLLLAHHVDPEFDPQPNLPARGWTRLVR